MVIRKSKLISWFIFSVFLALALGAWQLTRPTTGYQRGFFGGDAGESLGVVGLILIILIYARTLLKLLLANGGFWQRLQPLNTNPLPLKTLLGRALYYLNKSHGWLGALAVASIFGHCYLTGSWRDNLVLQAVLVLMAWQGFWGLVLKIKYVPADLKSRGYLWHAQVYSGIVLLVFAAVGHLLLDD
ncbi:hypothetical protein HGA34_02730 [Candidatus Falkowbacteria bacterium]|nr:hypothetical protein [Candidatus Falkowbacteria bacterium]